MTPSDPKRVEILKSEPRRAFSDWWFINGGILHSLWKRKRYSEINRLAKDLPLQAWLEAWCQASTAYDAALERAAGLEAALNKIAYDYDPDLTDMEIAEEALEKYGEKK